MLTLGIWILAALLSGAVLVYLYGLAKRRAQRMQAVIAVVEQRFGFRNNSPGGVMPNLFAEINGMKTAVDVCYQSYVRGDTHNGRRPYTRVRVQLQEAPAVSVRVRAQRYESEAAWPAHATGDAVFDESFVALAASESDLALLGPEVRAAFVAAGQPVTLMDKWVMWVERDHTLDPERLVAAVQSCIDVAAAVRRDQDRGLH